MDHKLMWAITYANVIAMRMHPKDDDQWTNTRDRLDKAATLANACAAQAAQDFINLMEQS